MPELKEEELVVCRVKQINPHSVLVDILDYGREGMIHISELASGWVRDIRQHVREGELVVAKVIKLDEIPMLSLKRVKREEKRTKLREYELEKRAKKLLEVILEKSGKIELQSEIERRLKDSFGSVAEAFRVAKRREELIEKEIGKELAELMKIEADELFKRKEIVFKAELVMSSLAPNGIEIIKQVLEKAKSSGLEVSYISAPRYLVKYSSRDPKRGEKSFLKKLEEVKKFASTLDCELEVKLKGGD